MVTRLSRFAWANRSRLAWYGAISVVCFMIHYGILRYLNQGLMLEPALLCNAVAFFISAQINGSLQQWRTFKDRPSGDKSTFAARMALYNATAAVSLALNEAGFAAARNYSSMLLADQFVGAVLGLVFTYPVCHYLIFREKRTEPAAVAVAQFTSGQVVTLPVAVLNGDATVLDLPAPARHHEPRRLVVDVHGLPQQYPTATRPGVAVVMPAWKEALNLRSTVQKILAVLQRAEIPVVVVIASDGGLDGTPKLAKQLSDEYPGLVVVANHVDQHGEMFNQGYGGAVRTAIEWGLPTGMMLICSVDADGQFVEDDIVRAVDMITDQQLDVVWGRRKNRRQTDGLKRYLMGKAWTAFASLFSRKLVLDADCSLRVFRARSLQHFQGVSEKGAFGLELWSWTVALGLKVAFMPVTHLRRVDEENQSGSNLGVVLGSFKSVPHVYANLYRHGYRLRRLRRLWAPRDVGAYWVTVVAMLASVAAFVWYYRQGMTLLYPDAISHLLIAHRFNASPTPGIAQYGGVWLPADHMAETPFLAVPYLYQTGIGGSIVHMLAFVVAARYLYKAAVAITGWVWSGVVAAAIFVLNPNVLYMQSTSMEEVSLYACTAAAIFFAVRYGQTRDWKYSAGMSLAAGIGCGIRYEGWVVALALMVYVLGLGVFPWKGRHSLKAKSVLYAFVPGLFLLLWVAYCTAIFGNPLYWYNGPYAKPSNWTSHEDVAINHPLIAAKTYWYASADTIGWVMLGLLIAGTVLFVIRAALRRQSAAPLVLLALPAFFVGALDKGQRPLHVMQINHSLYNVRFALIMVLPAAIFVGCGIASVRTVVRRLGSVRLLRPLVAVAVAAAALAALAGLVSAPATTIQEGRVFASSQIEVADAQAALAMKVHWTGGYALVQDYGDEVATFRSGIPLQNVIYEGTNQHDLWKRALRDPLALGVRMIYMRQTPGNQDQVWLALHNSPVLQKYHLVFKDADQLVYVRDNPGHARRPALAIAPERGSLMHVRLPRVHRGRRSAHRLPGVTVLPGRFLARGGATWFMGARGTCQTSVAPLGSRVMVTNRLTGAHVVCRVAGAGPGAHGRIVNLDRRQFALLGNLADGVVPVGISATLK